MFCGFGAGGGGGRERPGGCGLMASMKDDTPPPNSEEVAPDSGESQAPKKAHQSKTLWLNGVAILAALVPTVQQWLAENPVEFVSALAALNILVRFVTSGKVSLFGPKAASLCVMGFAMLAALLLTSCQVWRGFDMVGSVHYRDDSGAKGGVKFGQGRQWRPYLRVPVETDSGTGFVDLTSGK